MLKLRIIALKIEEISLQNFLFNFMQKVTNFTSQSKNLATKIRSKFITLTSVAIVSAISRISRQASTSDIMNSGCTSCIISTFENKACIEARSGMTNLTLPTILIPTAFVFTFSYKVSKFVSSASNIQKTIWKFVMDLPETSISDSSMENYNSRGQMKVNSCSNIFEIYFWRTKWQYILGLQKLLFFLKKWLSITYLFEVKKDQ